MGYDERQLPGGDGRTRARRPHIFVVNREPALLDMLRLTFAAEGYDATAATVAPDPLDRIVALDPDALVVDVAWGDGAGWALLERLRAEPRTRRIPVVVTSTTPEYLERARADPARYGARTTLLMPNDLDALPATVGPLVGLA